MNEQNPEVRPTWEEVSEITPEQGKKVPIEVIEGILKQIYNEENRENQKEKSPTIH